MSLLLRDVLSFNRREIVLIAGLLLFMVGLIPFMGPAYAALIVIAMYVGIKAFVGRKRRLIEQDVGEGVCMECGAKVSDKRCPNCDRSGK